MEIPLYTSEQEVFTFLSSAPSSIASILLNAPALPSDKLLTTIISHLAPKGSLTFKVAPAAAAALDPKQIQNTVLDLTVAGYSNISSTQPTADGEALTLVAYKPDVLVGTKKALNLGDGNTTPVKLNLADDDVIDEETLLEDNDVVLAKKAAQKSKDCGVDDSGQLPKGRKPCKNCTCGAADVAVKLVIDDEPAKQKAEEKKSACGNCALGDAFRCASCPYLGMPPFKPGETVTIGDKIITSDL